MAADDDLPEVVVQFDLIWHAYMMLVADAMPLLVFYML